MHKAGIRDAEGAKNVLRFRGVGKGTTRESEARDRFSGDCFEGFFVESNILKCGWPGDATECFVACAVEGDFVPVIERRAFGGGEITEKASIFVGRGCLGKPLLTTESIDIERALQRMAIQSFDETGVPRRRVVIAKGECFSFKSGEGEKEGKGRRVHSEEEIRLRSIHSLGGRMTGVTFCVPWDSPQRA